MDKGNESEGEEKSEILDANVLMGGKFGLTTILSIIEYPPAMDKCVALYPNKEDFNLALDIAFKLRLKGTPIGAVDIIVASMCMNRNFTLVTKDKDYLHIKEIEKEVEKILDLKMIN